MRTDFNAIEGHEGHEGDAGRGRRGGSHEEGDEGLRGLTSGAAVVGGDPVQFFTEPPRTFKMSKILI